jgi:uncharacterized protein (TIGR02598 family)
MTARRIAARNDGFYSRKARDAGPRQYVVSETDSPLPSQGRGEGDGFAIRAANVEKPLTSIHSPSVRVEAENVSVTLNHNACSPDHRCHSRATAFSLVEVVLALGVASFCLIAIVGLMPVGVQTNRNAASQTAATNLITTIVADLRTTPAAATTSPEFAITFGTDKTLYFDASGQVSTSLGPDSRYRLSITWNSAPTGLQYALLKVTWPASVDPATASPSGAVKIFAAFDRN